VLNAHNIGADDVLILGRDGLLFAGPNSRRHEELLLFHLSLLVREMFVRVFFVRTFVLDDQLKKIRMMIMDHEKDPNNIPRVRSELNGASRDIILLQEVLSYLLESLQIMEVPDRPEDEVCVVSVIVFVSYICTCIHTHNAYRQTYRQTYMHANMQDNMHTCMHACVHTNMHTCMHISLHMHIMHTCTAAHTRKI